MRWNGCLISISLAAALASAPGPLAGATFGNVVTTVGGHPADIALDESRGKLYIANFTALEIDVMSTKDNAIHSSIPLPSHPSALALSPDSAYLVVTEYQNGTSVPPGFDGVTVINLASNAKQNFTTGDPALGVAFVNTGQALIATSTGFYLLDPVSGYLQAVTSVAAAAGQPLPVPQATFPPQIIQTQMTASADGRWIWGVAIGGTEAQTGAQLVFRYNVGGSFVGQVWVTSPPLLPRVSVAADGSWAMIGWTKFAPAQCGGSGFMIPSRYPQSVASTNVTGHAVNAKNGATDTIYAQIFDTTQPSAPPYYPATPSASTSTGTATPAKFPTLSIMDVDNLTVRDKVYLPEDLVGRAVLDSAGNNMYAISDSGVTVLPVGSLNHYPRLAASVEDVLVQTNFCNVTPLKATFTIADPGNNGTDFSISSPQAGVLISPASGKTPATITVTVQPGAIPNPGGTLAVPLTINSASAVNVGPAVRLLISNPDLDQRGTIVGVPGQLVDLLPDPAGRNRFYVMRQDKNQVLVFDGSNYGQIATLRTGTTPTGMSFTNDGKSLIVASTDSQLLQVFDLDSFQPQTPIQLPASHYGRSVAQSNVGTFVVVENDSAVATPSVPTTPGVPPAASVAPPAIDRLDLYSRCAYTPPALGIYTNSNAALPPTTVLSPSPDQNSILVAAPNGNVMLYDATHDTFILSRKDLSALSGAYAASSGASSSSSGPAFATRYVIGDNVFDASLVPQGTLDTSIGHTSGFAFMGAGGYRVTGTTASAAGVIQNLPNVLQATNVKPVRTIEAPILTSTSQTFTRSVAPLGNTIVLLTTSGVTVLAPNYDAAVASPSISSVVSAADGSASVAPGGLISVYGQQMSPLNMATSQIPLPTALAGSCLAVNGVPAPLLFVSSQQVNAQLPASASGTVTLSIHTPGGVSDNFFVPILAAAPTVFRSGTAGPETGLATVFRNDNGQLITPTNPIHPGDIIIVYATGMGRTSPFVDSGLPALLPPDPLSNTVTAASVTLGGVPLNVLYSGLVPGEVGVYQVNASVPSGVPQGMDIPLVIAQGGSSTALSVRVVK
jgi:uncharacterized protein (TIGR03437 family)